MNYLEGEAVRFILFIMQRDRITNQNMSWKTSRILEIEIDFNKTKK